MKSRANKAASAIRIRQRPQDYKLCLGCDSVLHRPVIDCPRCHTYRFETDTELIRAAAIKLAAQS